MQRESQAMVSGERGVSCRRTTSALHETGYEGLVEYTLLSHDGVIWFDTVPRPHLLCFAFIPPAVSYAFGEGKPAHSCERFPAKLVLVRVLVVMSLGGDTKQSAANCCDV